MRVLALTAVCAAMLCGCDTASRSHVAEIGGGVWDRPVTVTLPNSDTLGIYDMIVALRHDGSLEGRTVEMTVRTVTPDSLWTEEVLSVTVGDDGRSRSALHEAAAVYRRRVRLAREGDYRITITPERPVKGVSAVGVEMSHSANE